MMYVVTHMLHLPPTHPHTHFHSHVFIMVPSLQGTELLKDDNGDAEENEQMPS